MADLVITTLPNRKSKYLAIREGSTVRVLARFSFEGAEAEFIDWAVKAGIRYAEPEKE